MHIKYYYDIVTFNNYNLKFLTGSDNSSYLRVNYNHDTKTITCTFLGELESSSIKSCHIVYGICQPRPNVHSEKAMNSTTTQSSNTATIRLHSAIMGYCFTATAAAMSNSGYLVSVQLIDGVIVDSAGELIIIVAFLIYR